MSHRTISLSVVFNSGQHILQTSPQLYAKLNVLIKNISFGTWYLAQFRYFHLHSKAAVSNLAGSGVTAAAVRVPSGQRKPVLETSG